MRSRQPPLQPRQRRRRGDTGEVFSVLVCPVVVFEKEAAAATGVVALAAKCVPGFIRDRLKHSSASVAPRSDPNFLINSSQISFEKLL